MKAPSNKLFPFVKLLLAENSLMQSSAAAAAPNGVKVGVTPSLIRWLASQQFHTHEILCGFRALASVF